MSEDFGTGTDVEVIDRVLAVRGLDLVDVGCGAGALTRVLAARGARVLGVEPDPVQAARNRKADAVDGVTFAEAPAQALPVADRSTDGVVFCRSLHHVPPADMDAALAEAMRALRPESGFLYVIEPVMAGSYAELVRPFNDETEVRRLAYEALTRCAAPRFARAREIRYVRDVTYPDFAAFLGEKLGITYTDHRRAEIDTPEVRARFEAGRAGGEYRFEHRSRVNWYQGLETAG